MKPKRWALSWIASLAAASAAPTPDGVPAWRIETRAEVAAETGTTTYRIGGTVVENGEREELPFPISRLKWPMPRWSGRVAVEARHRSRWELFGALAAAPSQDAGTLEDSDWEAPEMPDVVTTYSESDTEAQGLEVEAGARRSVYEWSGVRDEIELSAGFGLSYRRHQWTARDAIQWSPPFPELGADGIWGDVATYETEVWMPYLEIAGTWRRKLWEIRARLTLSPYVRAEDRDDHLVRGIESRATTEGVGGKAELRIRRALAGAWFAYASLYGSAFATEGTSRNVVYGDDDPEIPVGARWTIEQKIESEQFGAALGVGARF